MKLAYIIAAGLLGVILSSAGYAAPFDPMNLLLGASLAGVITQAPMLSQVKKYAVNKAGEAECIGQSLYDFVLYPTAGQININFFQNPVGQGLSSSPGNANQPKALSDTNMRAPGQLPSPQMFLLTNIQVIVQPGSVSTANTFTPQHPFDFVAVPSDTAMLSGVSVNDCSAILESGWLQCDVASKNYLTEAKLNRFPAKAKSVLDAAVSTNSATTGAMSFGLLTAGGEPYPIDPPILIPSNQNFSITAQWPVAVATPSGFNARIGVVLDGYLYRSVQ